MSAPARGLETLAGAEVAGPQHAVTVTLPTAPDGVAEAHLDRHEGEQLAGRLRQRRPPGSMWSSGGKAEEPQRDTPGQACAEPPDPHGLDGDNDGVACES